MTGLQSAEAMGLAVAVGVLAAAFAVVAWRRGRRFEGVESRLARLEQRDPESAQRLGDEVAELKQTAQRLNDALDEVRPQRRGRRRPFNVIEGGAVILPVVLIAGMALAATAVSVLARDNRDELADPSPPPVVPQQSAPPVNVSATPGVTVVLPAAEAVPAQRRASSPPERGPQEGGGGLVVVPPDGSPPPPPTPPVSVPEDPAPVHPPVEVTLVDVESPTTTAVAEPTLVDLPLDEVEVLELGLVN